ncbi:MAG: hypothetical protein OZ948_06640 [Deltaproteobacteria bacterium]|nr:hypothetical protein [Deltaproteobacteria bacterium]
MDIADAITRLATRLPSLEARSAGLAGRTAGAQGAEESEPAERASALGRDEFLTMLLAQLQNQDPLNPQDATEFTAQLATFSMLEQLISIQSGIGRVEKLLEDVLTGQPAETTGTGAAARAPVAVLAPPETAR